LCCGIDGNNTEFYNYSGGVFVLGRVVHHGPHSHDATSGLQHHRRGRATRTESLPALTSGC
jgi:hypothetical protein